jgi:hypothetical protein
LTVFSSDISFGKPEGGGLFSVGRRKLKIIKTDAKKIRYGVIGWILLDLDKFE